MQGESAADTTIWTDGIRLGLLPLIPSTSLTQLVLATEHQRTSGTYADTIATIHAGALGKLHRALAEEIADVVVREGGGEPPFLAVGAQPTEQAGAHVLEPNQDAGTVDRSNQSAAAMGFLVHEDGAQLTWRQMRVEPVVGHDQRVAVDTGQFHRDAAHRVSERCHVSEMVHRPRVVVRWC